MYLATLAMKIKLIKNYIGIKSEGVQVSQFKPVGEFRGAVRLNAHPLLTRTSSENNFALVIGHQHETKAVPTWPKRISHTPLPRLNRAT